jgi:murein DD-endopeptidase MepM/ murein hydrolase activator NlpD
MAAAFSLLLFIFRLGFYVRQSPAPGAPASPRVRNSPRDTPAPGHSPSPPDSSAGRATSESRATPENRDAPRPAGTPATPPPGGAIVPAGTGASGLRIPVVGVRPENLRDTYSEARAEGRTHNALDIMANCDAPVVAALTGKIIKLFHSDRGGITIYQMGPDNRTVYYYAHLSRYADGLAEGRVAQAGEVIGYVGDTGNAGAGNCHLHFAIWIVTDPKRYWDGENINPYPLLRGLP